MTTKHTPAPWFVDSDPEGAGDCQGVWYSKGQGVSAEIAGRICEPGNAALIAAAPTMLEALEQVFVTLGRLGGNMHSASHKSPPGVREAWLKTREALNKAGALP